MSEEVTVSERIVPGRYAPHGADKEIVTVTHQIFVNGEQHSFFPVMKTWEYNHWEEDKQ